MIVVVEKMSRLKSHKNFSSKFEEIRAKSFPPPKIACSYTYDTYITCICVRLIE